MSKMGRKGQGERARRKDKGKGQWKGQEERTRGKDKGKGQEDQKGGGGGRRAAKFNANRQQV